MAKDTLPGGLVIEQQPDCFKVTQDAILLADFARPPCAQARLCDLGCGSGVLMLLLCGAYPRLTADGVERQTGAAQLARENIRANGLEERAAVHTGDVRNLRGLLSGGRYDIAVCNPPYYPAGSGRVSAAESLRAARHEGEGTLEDMCAAARFLVRFGGRFCLVHKPEALPRLFSALEGSGFAVKRLRLVQLRADTAPLSVLVEGRRGGNPGLTILPPLVLQTDTGEFSPEYQRIYRLGDAI